MLKSIFQECEKVNSGGRREEDDSRVSPSQGCEERGLRRRLYLLHTFILYECKKVNADGSQGRDAPAGLRQPALFRFSAQAIGMRPLFHLAYGRTPPGNPCCFLGSMDRACLSEKFRHQTEFRVQARVLAACFRRLSETGRNPAGCAENLKRAGCLSPAGASLP